MTRSFRGAVPAGLALAAVALVAGCSAPDSLIADGYRVQVVTATELIADLVRRVGGDRLDVASIVPAGADPHSYEPTLRNVRDVVYADLAFSNYLMLEQQAVVSTLDANVRDGVPNIALAEDAVKYAAEIIPLVENVALDTIWLGLRVRGDGRAMGADRTSSVALSATDVRGPGEVFAYLIGSFGQPERYFDSTDGFDAADGYRGDTATLPPAAHSHMSWAFTEPGSYELDLSAALQVERTERPIEVGAATVRFAVGIDPLDVANGDDVILDGGHADIAVDLDESSIVVVHDPEGGGESTQRVLPASSVVISVPNTALHDIPPDPSMRFLGRAGEQIHQLPQAVLGRHVHGEIDPHLWHDVGNVMAYVQLIRDELIAVDPAGAPTYHHNAERYLDELAALDDEVRSTLAAIPERNRRLVTTHDAFAYLAHAYDLEIAGFVTPNPSTEPSLLERRRLAATISDLRIPAVFLEPNLITRSSTLTELAADAGVQVCPILGDAFTAGVASYVELMRFNAASLARCLT